MNNCPQKVINMTVYYSVCACMCICVHGGGGGREDLEYCGCKKNLSVLVFFLIQTFTQILRLVTELQRKEKKNTSVY